MNNQILVLCTKAIVNALAGLDCTIDSSYSRSSERAFDAAFEALSEAETLLRKPSHESTGTVNIEGYIGTDVTQHKFT